VNDERMVCRHCGGDKFHAEVTVSAWLDSTGVWVGDDGKPHFESSGSPQDASSYEYDVESYVCSTCERSSSRLAELVVRAPRNGEAIGPCGRCDHSRVDHPEQRWIKPKGSSYTRGPMPCEHEGCDCHDYYDMSVLGQSLEEARAA
jgi:hypothetical protein